MDFVPLLQAYPCSSTCRKRTRPAVRMISLYVHSRHNKQTKYLGGCFTRISVFCIHVPPDESQTPRTDTCACNESVLCLKTMVIQASRVLSFKLVLLVLSFAEPFSGGKKQRKPLSTQMPLQQAVGDFPRQLLRMTMSSKGLPILGSQTVAMETTVKSEKKNGVLGF